MTDDRRSLRSALGAPVRRVVAGANDSRFDAVEAGLARLVTQLDAVERRLVHNELEVAAVRQRLDEALDFLRLQHDIVRDLLEELRPLLESRRSSSESARRAPGHGGAEGGLLLATLALPRKSWG